MSARGDSDKKKRKAYYRKCAAASKRQRLSCDSSYAKGKSVPKALAPGMTGYIVTCNKRESSALMDAFRLLNDALHRFEECKSAAPDDITKNGHTSVNSETSDDHVNNGQEQTTTKESDKSPSGSNDEDEDILSQLQRENANLTEDTNSATDVTTHETNQDSSKAARTFSFYSVRSGVSNCLFILHYPNTICAADLACSIFEHLLETQESQSRNVLRLMPVAGTCHASPTELERCVQTLWATFLKRSSPAGSCQATVTEGNNCSLKATPDCSTLAQTDSQATLPGSEDNAKSELGVPLPDDFHRLCPNVPPQLARTSTIEGPKTYLVMFKARNYDRLSREVAMNTVVSAVRTVDSTWSVCPDSPSVMIFVNVFRNVACVSFLENFDRYRKYNIAELLLPPSNAAQAAKEESPN
ncbi:unnamed protein product [Calicophoron daubneyi]|uniref:THUMP domain-containing protein n=1 Tax=Calicophoron daubneyi TaxID=300641 RepID=A0AAV2TVY8_CALDB